ncbi:hypothetical protein [Halobacillus ihumii]|uniref:hypothetical protein n=1 Tax=Halobacillus ihumii TaxID=2686092 RepID=UPI0013CF968D|nr:hypothetical protein [Halobacillus ihumii]
MYCDLCEKELKKECYVGDEGVFCNQNCSLTWYAENIESGYYTTVSDYKKYIKELEERLL